MSRVSAAVIPGPVCCQPAPWPAQLLAATSLLQDTDALELQLPSPKPRRALLASPIRRPREARKTITRALVRSVLLSCCCQACTSSRVLGRKAESKKWRTSQPALARRPFSRILALIGVQLQGSVQLQARVVRGLCSLLAPCNRYAGPSRVCRQRLRSGVEQPGSLRWPARLPAWPPA